MDAVPEPPADVAKPGNPGMGRFRYRSDGWNIPAGCSAIAEVYPALWSRSFAKDDRTGDQHDAFTTATWLSRADRDGTLAAFLKPDLSPRERTVARVEGWILGVPGLIRAGGERDASV